MPRIFWPGLADAQNPGEKSGVSTSAPPASPAPVSAAGSPRVRGGARPVCAHCGAPAPEGEEFCCGGCAFVSRLIRDEGLESFYALKDKVTQPADGALEPSRDFGWLAVAARAAAAEAGASGRAAELELAVQGMSCAACGWLIERLFKRRSGPGEIEVSAETGRMRLRWAPEAGFDAADFARELQRFGYLAGPADAASAGGETESRMLARKAGLAAALAMNAMMAALPYYFGMAADFEYARLFEAAGLLFATLSVFACGGYFLLRAVESLRARLLHLDLPIALGIVGAYLGSVYGWATANPECQYFDFVTGFIALMLTGRWAQVAAVERNRRRLLREQPVAARVRVRRGGAWTEADAESLVVGERFTLAAGALVPVEARLEAAEAEFSLAWITGEAEAKLFKAGQRVPAGASLAGGGREVDFTAAQAWAGSLLAELSRPVERAPERARLIETVVKWYLVGILGAAFGAGAWWALRNGDAAQTGAVVISILVVSCPCALGLAFPLTEEIATVRLRKRGVFVRAGDLWQRLNRVGTVVFDKTGTLTRETPSLRNPDALDTLDADARAALFALVRDNPHPVGRSLHEAILLRAWTEWLDGEVNEETGRGVRLGEWRLERAGEGDGDAALRRGDETLARFFFAEAVRLDAREELAALKKRGLGLAVLSGDRDEKVAALAAELGVAAEWARGGLDPREKAAWLDAHAVGAALMLGDGANDSLAFDRALCRGTPAVHRGVLGAKSDFYYLGRGIGGVRALLEVNDARRSTQAALLIFMIAYNLAAVGLAATGHMNPLFAAVLMPLSSLATLAIVWMGLRGTNTSRD